MKEGYCPDCKKNVETQKKSFSFLTAFLLAFTGIGLVIYILSYLDRKSDRCINCEAICQPIQLIEEKKQSVETPQVIPKHKVGMEAQYCPNCGESIADHKEDDKFCQLCGSEADSK